MSRALALSLTLLAIAPPSGAQLPVGMSSRPLPLVAAAVPPLPDPAALPYQLVLDDDGAESVFGFGGGTARQFLWLNQFDSPGPFVLTQIWVLFPAGTDVAVGDEIELLVYLDADTDPANGAELLASIPETVQAADGVTFSIYSIPRLDVGGPGEVLLGVVNRYFETGVDAPPTEPAAYDTDVGQNRSYVATWGGDPPPAPDLATASGFLRLDGNLSGNFMIRGFGPPAIVPTLSSGSLAALALLLLAAGGALVRRSRPRS